MERRDRSLKALEELIYISSLDAQERADGLVRWASDYLKTDISDFDLEIDDLKQLSELFYSNIVFLKDFKDEKRIEMKDLQKLKKFAEHK